MLHIKLQMPLICLDIVAPLTKLEYLLDCQDMSESAASVANSAVPGLYCFTNVRIFRVNKTQINKLPQLQAFLNQSDDLCHVM